MEWLQKEELEGFPVKASYCGGGVNVLHVTFRSQSAAPSETPIWGFERECSGVLVLKVYV
jgi:hypothetical protein